MPLSSMCTPVQLLLVGFPESLELCFRLRVEDVLLLYELVITGGNMASLPPCHPAESIKPDRAECVKPNGFEN